jgi:type IV pilus assembly protein PilA
MRSLCKHENRGPRTKASAGFSLIELLIVVAIILIIAAIAIPNLIRAKIAANESSAVSSIHGINTAEMAYSTINPVIGYSALLADLGPAGGGYIDAVLASGSKSGYTFTYTQGAGAPSNTYTINADPAARGVTGQRSFYSDQSNVSHYNINAPAGLGDPQL